MEASRLFYDSYSFVDLPSTIPHERIVRIEPRPVCARSSMNQLLQGALANPIKSHHLEDHHIASAAVIFSDETRLPSPYLTSLVRILVKMADDVKLVVACGTHILPSEHYLTKMIGDELLRNCRVVFSSTNDESCKFEYMGQTSRGTPVEVNKEILDVDFVLSSLCVRPHYFAGFEGGAKAILPGCSSLRTISSNHSYVIGNPN